MNKKSNFPIIMIVLLCSMLLFPIVLNSADGSTGTAKNCSDLGSSCANPNSGCMAYMWHGEPTCQLRCVFNVFGIPIVLILECGQKEPLIEE